jgi:hypothetical protein
MARKPRKKKRGNFYPESVGEYKVGYGKVPKEAQYKEGCASPNPSGRPKGSKNKPRSPDEMTQMIQEEGNRMLDIKGGKSMPTSRAIVRKINIGAATGNVRAQKLATDLLIASEARDRERRDQIFMAAFEYKKQWKEECKLRRQHGLPDPQVFPHPDDLLLNFETGEVTMVGLTRDQEELLDLLIYGKKYYEAALYQLANEAEDDDEDHRAFMHDVSLCVSMISKFSKALGDPWPEEELKQAPDFERMKELKNKVMRDLGRMP